MTSRVALLVGTPKGAFILESDAARRDWSIRGPLCDGWPVHDISVEPGNERAPRRGGQPVVRPSRVAERGPGRDLDPLVARGSRTATTGRKVADRVERDRGRRRHLRGRRAGGPVPEASTRADGGSTSSASPITTAGPNGVPARAGSSSTRSSPTPPTATGCGSASRRWAYSRRRTAARAGRPATRACARGSNPENRFPDFGQCVHKLVIAADGDERLYQQNHCGVYRSTDGGAAVAGDHRRPAEATSGSSMTAHPRDPLTVWNIPLTDPEQGRADAGRVGGGLADARRRRHLDPLGRRAAPAERVYRRPAARRWRPTASTRSGVDSAPARASSMPRPTRAGRCRGRGQPAADLVRRGACP